MYCQILVTGDFLSKFNITG